MSIGMRNPSEQLVDLVRDRILNGSVAPDRPIRQDALAAEMGVSKIPLREALARLEEEGLLVSQANRGFTVRPLAAAEAEEVFALRLTLEPEMIALAARQADAAAQQAATDLLDRLYSLTDRQGDGVGAFNRAFHLALLRPAGRPVTYTILERLHVLSERYVRKHLEPLGRNERANEEHRELLETWLARDERKIAALAVVHIGKTLDDLRLQLSTDDNR
ncbi:DNA-binding GntR family transcriptional regulator [Blastomonas natatoria]|uniref:DNA-binding GntR family transcriptional regulator n=1 Tax=Blastomonas natatoria TaxID=34015 RepID=A0A2V3URR9_9SPHN|nr:GntR family transcriptional regulator [Blastomonas natatoria]PXW70051.1 DNA-binding GntR family transcriptional regulator [Blastomonas natatoria]